jgi:enamine deaminase RidA (YjgF/YER057c/UK114 family)
MKTINPDTIAKPASNYAHGTVHDYAGGQRLIISGQVGNRLDGTLEDGLEAQTERAFQNVFAVVEAAGFERRHLVRLVVYVTEPGRVAAYRETRDRLLEGHCCANTYIEVAGLAAPGWLVEIEAEAVKEA